MKRLLAVILLFSFLPVSTLAKTVVYAPDYVGEQETIRAEFEDTLVHLARDNNLGFVEMRAANPRLDPWIPGAGARVILPKRHILPDAPRDGVVINLSDMRLYYFPPGGKEPLTYSIGIGREGLNTPLGTTKIVNKIVGPTWTPTERMRREDPKLPPFVPPGPENPLGTHALYLGFPLLRIHGTNKPYGIGRRVSSGCIRMYPEGIKSLYPKVPVGTKVTIVDQPVKVGWIEDKMYIEVHPTQDQSMKIEEDGVLNAYEITKADLKRITAKAGEHADKIDWVKVREAVREHSGLPVEVLNKNRTPSAKRQNELETIIDQADSKKPAKAEKKSASAQDIEEKILESAQTIPPAQTTSSGTRSYNFNN